LADRHGCARTQSPDPDRRSLICAARCKSATARSRTPRSVPVLGCWQSTPAIFAFTAVTSSIHSVPRFRNPTDEGGECRATDIDQMIHGHLRCCCPCYGDTSVAHSWSDPYIKEPATWLLMAVGGFRSHEGRIERKYRESDSLTSKPHQNHSETIRIT